MLRLLFAASLAALVATPLFPKSFAEMFPTHPGYDDVRTQEILESIEYSQGEILLPGGQAKLEVPTGYYYLAPADANRILSDLWGNPPSDQLGMIFPAPHTPMDWAAWGAMLNWDPIGYVSDRNAGRIDFDDLLEDMQGDTAIESEERRAAGYGGLELVGWAAAPEYDADRQALYWAEELHFDEADANTLNYRLRRLGRNGVLQANFIATMDQLEQVSQALPDLIEMQSFTEGNRYADFDARTDVVSEMGLGGLVAGKIIRRTGIVGAAVLMLQKFWIVLLLPILGIWQFWRTRGSD